MSTPPDSPSSEAPDTSGGDAPEPKPMATDVRPRWARLHLWQIQVVRDVLTVVVVWAFFWLGNELSLVTVPLLLAVLLAYLTEPFARWMIKRFDATRQAAAAIVVILMATFVVLPATIGLGIGVYQGAKLVGYVSEQASNLRSALEEAPYEPDDPGYQEWTGSAEQSRWLSERTGAVDDLSGGWRWIYDAVVQARADQDRDADPADGSGEAEGTDTTQNEATEDDDADVPTPSEVGERMRSGARDLVGQLGSRALDQDGADGEPDASARGEAQSAPPAGALSESNLQLVLLISGWIEGNASAVAAYILSSGGRAIDSLVTVVGGLAFLGFQVFLTLFFLFFVSAGWHRLLAFGRSLLPRKNSEHMLDLVSRFDRAIAAFVRGRLTIAAIQAVVFSVSYALIGVPAAVLLGLLVAVLAIVPYLALVGLPISMVLLWLEPYEGYRGTWWWTLGAPAFVYFAGQALDDYVWTPLIQGRETGMSTPAILFASLAGGVLFGVFGLLIAIPLAACVKIYLEADLWPRYRDWREGKRSDFLPIE